MKTQVTCKIAIKATGSIIRSSVPGWEDVTTLVRSSGGSVLKSAFIELLYLRAIICSSDPKANHKPQAKFIKACKRPSESIHFQL